MQWDVLENRPPLAMTGAVIKCDGRPVDHVRAFNTDEGWLEACCLRGHGHPEWSGRKHVDPSDSTKVCTYVRRGEVTVEWPEGPPEWLEPVLRNLGWEPPE